MSGRLKNLVGLLGRPETLRAGLAGSIFLFCVTGRRTGVLSFLTILQKKLMPCLIIFLHLENSAIIFIIDFI